MNRLLACIIFSLVASPPVAAASQTISFEQVAVKKTNAPPFAIGATTTSELPLDYQVNVGPASVSADGTVTLDGSPGAVTIRISQAGSDSFEPAEAFFTFLVEDTDWVSVACGYFHTVAVRVDRTLWAWGLNANGQLGEGTTTQRTSPVQVGSATNWASVACGRFHTVAVRTDGTLWAWGNNSYGQLGDGTTTQRTSPVQVGVATTWASVACGGSHTVAVRTDGTLWAWGYNLGQLGDGTTTQRTSPVQVGIATNWASVACGYFHTVAVRVDRTLWSWGNNSYGQLGDGTTTQRTSPVQVGSVTSWAAVACGAIHTVAVRMDGTQWAWGDNNRMPSRTLPLPVEQVVDFPPPPLLYVGSSVTLSATAASGLPLRYAVSGPASLEGNVLTPTAPGTVHLSAFQEGDHTWAPAKLVRIMVDVEEAPSIPVIAVEAPEGDPAAPGEVLGFGTVASGASGSPLAVLITNPGSAALEISGVAVTGAHAADFQLDLVSTAMSLDPEDETAFTVTFSPSSAGVRTATLTIASNDPENPEFVLNLTGTGNTPPSLSGYAFTAIYQTPTTVNLAEILAAASDPDGDAVSVASISPATREGGTATLSDSTLIYTPPAGFSGADLITLVLEDARGARVQAQIAVTVGAAFPAPEITEGGVTSITRFAATVGGSVNPRGGATSAQVEYGTTASYGSSVEIPLDPADGTEAQPFSVPLAGLEAATTYHYRIGATNSGGPSSTAGASFTTLPNVAPSFGGLEISTPFETTTTISLAELLAGITDVDGDEFSVTNVGTTSAEGGSAQFGAEGVIYTPPAGFSGTDTFPVTVTDVYGGETTANVTVAVLVPLPQIVDGDVSAITRFAATITGNVNPMGGTTNAWLEYGLSESYGLTSSITLATADGIEPQQFSVPLAGLTPGTNYHYRFLASNAGGTSATPDASFTTLPNIAPEFTGYSAATGFETPLTIALADLMASITDAEGDNVSVTEAGPASTEGGSALLQASVILYTPPPGFFGADTFPVTVTDGYGAATTANVTVRVGASSASETHSLSSLKVNPDKSVTLNLLAADVFASSEMENCYLQYSFDLEDWIEYLEPIVFSGPGERVEVVVPPPPDGEIRSNAFYRLRWEVSPAAVPLVHYTFENDEPLANSSVILNHAPGATQNGTFVVGAGAGNQFSYEPSGAPNGGTALRLLRGGQGYANLLASHINTGLTAADLNISPGTEYTAMAWVKFSNLAYDNFLFGQLNPPSLHLGIRYGEYHSDHWADTFAAGTAGNNEWVHLAFTNSATGVQEIFVNGVSIGSGEPGIEAQMVGTKNILVGTAGVPGFDGWMDEVKIFDKRLSQIEIQRASTIP